MSVLVTSLTSGVSIAAELIGTSQVQQVKLLDGAAGGTTGWSIPGGVGLVSVVPGAAVQVSGAVSVSAMPAITGNVGVSGAVSISAMPAITGLVTIQNSNAATTQAAVTGDVAWLAPTQTINATVNTIAAGFSVTISGQVVTNTGTQVVALGTVVASSVMTQSNAMGIPVWLVGGQSPTGQPVLVSVSSQANVVTQLATSGIPVWLAPTQTLNATVNTLAAGFSVQALVTVSGVTATAGIPTSVSPGLPVWLVGGQTATGSPILVSISSMPPVITQLATSGMVMWMAPTQTMSATVNTIAAGFSVQALVTVSGVTGTAGVPTSVSPGLPVWLVGGQTATGSPVLVSISSMPPAITQLATSGMVMWMAPTQTMTATVNTIAAGFSVQALVTVSGVTGTAGVPTSVSPGLPVWLVGGQTATGSPVLVSISSLAPQITQVATSGYVMWLAPTQTVSINRPAGQVLITCTSTSVIATSTTQFMLMSVLFDAYTASQLVSGYTVRGPLQFTGVTMVYSATSVTASSVIVALWVTTSGVSLTSNALPLWSTVIPTFTGAGVVTALPFPWTVILPQSGVMGLAVYRQTSLTTTLNVQFSITAQYID